MNVSISDWCKDLASWQKKNKELSPFNPTEDTKRLGKENLPDKLGHVFLRFFLLAGVHNIDLEEEMIRILKEIRRKMKRKMKRQMKRKENV